MMIEQAVLAEYEKTIVEGKHRETINAQPFFVTHQLLGRKNILGRSTAAFHRGILREMLRSVSEVKPPRGRPTFVAFCYSHLSDTREANLIVPYSQSQFAYSWVPKE
jgi:hypothetical protein